MNHLLYIELLENEVMRMRKEREAQRMIDKPSRRQGAVAGMLGLSQDEVNEPSEFTAPRNLTSETHDP